jgi:anti-sigma-K factor RskA
VEINEIISSGLLELYAMGLSSVEETKQVEQWAAQYPEIKAEIAAIQSGLEGYAQAHAVQPPPEVKAKLFGKINEDNDAVPVIEMNQANRPGRIATISPLWKYLAAASVLLFVVSGILTYNYYNKYNAAASELASTRNELQQEKEMAAMLNKERDMMSSPNALPVSLNKVSDMDGAARIYWMKDTKEVYIDPSHMPAPPSGMQYQFWAIVDKKPVSGGMIPLEQGNVKANINGMTVHLVKMKSFGKAEAFAVSLEKAGPERPTPDKVVVLGSVSL